MSPPTDDETPHLAAIQRSMTAGFQFLHLRDSEGQPVAIHAERRHGEVVETYTVQTTTEAIAARYRTEDYPGGDPLWEEHGTVEQVIAALLALPPHGAPGAPTTTRRTSSSLWLPGIG